MAKAESLVDEIAPGVLDALGVAEGALDTADPVAVMRSLRHALTRAAFRPQATVPAFARFGARVMTGGIDVAVRTLGAPPRRPRHPRRQGLPVPGPHLGAEPAVPRHARVVRRRHQAAARAGRGRRPRREHRAQGRVRRRADLRHARAHQHPAHQPDRAEARGRDLRRAACCAAPRNFLHDLMENDGWPSQVDSTPFTLGENVAATPGKVVFRNELIEMHPVHAADRRRVRDPVARVPAVDQPLLHRRSRAEEEPDRVGGAPRAHHVRDQLPQPRRVDARQHLRRLPTPRPAHRHRRRARSPAPTS